AHQLPDEEEEGDGEQRLGVQTIEELAHYRLHADRRQRGSDEHAGHERERHRDPDVPEPQEEHGHDENDPARLEDHGGSSSSSSRSSFRGAGVSNPKRMPLASCSITNRQTKTPAIGMARYHQARGVSDGMRKLPKPWRKFFQPNHTRDAPQPRMTSRLKTSTTNRRVPCIDSVIADSMRWSARRVAAAGPKKAP